MVARYLMSLLFSAVHLMSFAAAAQDSNFNELNKNTPPDSVVEEEVPQARVESQQDRLQISVGLQQYSVLNPQPGSTERKYYESLPPSEQRQFDRNREQFLAQAARALGVFRHGFGIGTLIKDKISYQLDSIKRDRAEQTIMTLQGGARADGLRALEAYDLESEKQQESSAKRTLAERSHSVITHLLGALDRNLWSQASLFARTNEFGLVAMIGIEALGGVQGKGGWGGLLDVGISIGYNKDEGLAIQIFRNVERFKSTSMKAVFIAGVMGSAGMYIANQAPDKLAREGSSFYPPMVPGFSTSTSDLFASGVSSGLSWPPSPLGDLLTYTNSLDSKTLIRIVISPKLKGFVRLKTGIHLEDFKILLMPFEKMINSVRALTMGRGLCQGVYLQ